MRYLEGIWRLPLRAGSNSGGRVWVNTIVPCSAIPSANFVTRHAVPLHTPSSTNISSISSLFSPLGMPAARGSNSSEHSLLISRVFLSLVWNPRFEGSSKTKRSRSPLQLFNPVVGGGGHVPPRKRDHVRSRYIPLHRPGANTVECRI